MEGEGKRARADDSDSAALSARERQLLDDLIVARDALEQAKQLLAHRLRHDASVSALTRMQEQQQQQRTLNMQLRASCRRLQHQLSKLPAALAAAGLDTARAHAVIAALEAPLDIRLECESVASVELRVAPRKRLRPAPKVVLRGTDAAAGATGKFWVLARLEGDKYAESLTGETLVPIAANGMAEFRELKIGGLPAGTRLQMRFELRMMEDDGTDEQIGQGVLLGVPIVIDPTT